MSWLDLHMHSQISLDGEFSPERLAALSDILWEYGGGTEPQNGKEG